MFSTQKNMKGYVRINHNMKCIEMDSWTLIMYVEDLNVQHGEP